MYTIELYILQSSTRMSPQSHTQATPPNSKYRSHTHRHVMNTLLKHTGPGVGVWTQRRQSVKGKKSTFTLKQNKL